MDFISPQQSAKYINRRELPRKTRRTGTADVEKWPKRTKKGERLKTITQHGEI
jgi:hypothetical protein